VTGIHENWEVSQDEHAPAHRLEQLSAEPIVASLTLAISPLFDDRPHQAQTAPVTCGKPDQSLAHTNRT
jgi:hypothetical protein